jgi:hypothetical protein
MTLDQDDNRFRAAWEAFVLSAPSIHFHPADRHLAYAFYLRGCIDALDAKVQEKRSELAKLGV